MTRERCQQRDTTDRLAPLRAQSALDDVDGRGGVYLDGNSLGVLPRRTLPRLAAAAGEEWGRGLVGSWNGAGWITLPERVGDKIARIIGAAPGDVIVADATSVNLFKALSAAVAVSRRHESRRVRIVSESSNFPSDLYIADTFAREHGLELMLVDADNVVTALDSRTAVLMLTHVNYRTGAMHDLARLTSAAHDVGAMTLWDLAHSAGAVPVALNDTNADFAIGCGYKYLNGGPGAPAFIWSHPRMTKALREIGWRSPLSGWLGHSTPFDFSGAVIQALIARGVVGDFRAPDILRFGLTPLYTRFVDVWDAVDRLVQILESGEWRAPRFKVRATVT
jgi:kynureninase